MMDDHGLLDLDALRARQSLVLLAVTNRRIARLALDRGDAISSARYLFWAGACSFFAEQLIRMKRDLNPDQKANVQ